METRGEPLLTRKIVVKSIVIMIAVVCIVGVFILDGPVQANRSVRSFIRQRTDQVSTDVLNGYQVKSGEFSSVVGITASIRTSPSKAFSFSCTGVLLSKVDVLTAGHCCHDAFGFTVHAGVEMGKKTYSVKNVWIMSGYKYNQFKDQNGETVFTPEKDLCMLRLTKVVDFTPEGIYISRTKPSVGEKVEIVGFGMIAKKTGSAGRLHYAQTTVTSCSNALNWASNKKNVVNDIVCAGHDSYLWTWTYAHNACSGDSGGPLLSPKLPKENARKLYGILSDGQKPCETGENSYTDVAKKEFREFIENHNSGFATWMPICNSGP